MWCDNFCKLKNIKTSMVSFLTYFFLLLDFYKVLRLIVATTHCLHASLTFARFSTFLTFRSLKTFFILSIHFCLGYPLDLLVLCFHLVHIVLRLLKLRSLLCYFTSVLSVFYNLQEYYRLNKWEDRWFLWVINNKIVCSYAQLITSVKFWKTYFDRSIIN